MNKLITTLAIATSMTFGINIAEQSFNMNQVIADQKLVLLGERVVTDKVDHDTIPVTVARGDFSRIKFTVKDHAVKIDRLVVHYGNGEPDKIELRSVIPAGGKSRVIDLRGGDRVIKKIDFWYETKSLGRQRAMVRVYGIR
jgi:hypothetical protein